MWLQKEIRLKARPRGFHLITDEVVQQLPELRTIAVGLCHLFIKHTSASLCINENADPDVRLDVESHFNTYIPENARYYQHVLEGSDDMPAHIKNITIGSDITIPINNSRLNTGTWQGIYLGEHRNHAGSRIVVVTLQGQDCSPE